MLSLNRPFILALLLLGCQTTNAQTRLPVLRATQPKLSIRQGSALYKDAWGVASAAKPDIFVAQPFKGKERIVFYSDLDSVAFWVKPQKNYDFVVLVNGQDSAYTRITTYRDKRPTLVPKLTYSRLRPRPAGPDTLGFQLDEKFGIHLQGKVNNSAPLNFLFDTGAGAVVLTSAIVNQRVRLNQDGQTVNAGADGSRSVLTSSGNTLEVGNLRWPNVSLLTIDYPNLGFDGVLGWVAFENKIVELDYERGYLVIHDQLPIMGPEYSSVDFKILDGLPFIKCTLTANGQSCTGWFDLDTGSDGGLVVGQQFAASHQLTSGLKRVGTAAASGSTGGVVRQAIFTLPKLKVGDYELYQVPLFVNEQDPAGGATPENIGSTLLKRFNLLLDFRQSRAYLKPNKYLYSPLQGNSEK